RDAGGGRMSELWIPPMKDGPNLSPPPVPKSQWTAWRDIGYAVRWTAIESHHVDWEVYIIDEIATIESEEDLPTPEFNGFVKWDGCANWAAGTDNMVHTCTRNHVRAIGELLLRVYDAAARMMP